MQYLSTKKTAERLGVSSSRVRQLLLDDRLPGAVRIGDERRGSWAIPEDAEPLPAGQAGGQVDLGLSRDELLERLRELRVGIDVEGDHIAADKALLDYIADPEIRSAFKAIPKFYA